MNDQPPNATTSEENEAISKAETALDVSNAAQPDPNPAGPTPVEDGVPGIQPIADYIPKDALTSHPTPPPDEPLVTSEANVDVEMASAGDAPQGVAATEVKVASPKQPETAPNSQPEPESLHSVVPPAPAAEFSLVRPREDEDADEEPAAKRGRFEDEPMPDAPAEAAADVVANGVIENPSAEIPVSKVEPDAAAAEVDGLADIPAADTAPVDDQLTGQNVVQEQQPGAMAPSVAPEADAKPFVAATAETAAKPADAESDAKFSIEASAQPQPAQSMQPQAGSRYSTKPITPAQNRFLMDKMKNLKKTKNSAFFLLPVDPVALNIPTYPDIIKNPMDLGTMEQKLKSGQYGSVQAFADDFDLIINNTRTFNGADHVVTQAGNAMDAYFRKMMESVPKVDQPAPPQPQPKKASPKPPSSARRESRSAAQPAAPALPTAQSGSEPFALQSDGTPQIRRDSTTNRPARAIKPPPARELAYAKPKRKEHQLELRFCEDVLNKIKGPRYASLNSIFLAPVDPVALNIPHYRQVVKHPMDLGTMSQKLKQGQYARAGEFKKDFDLMVSNCLAFNPPGNPVRDLGIQLQREFEALWREKDKWEKKRRAEMARNASSADEESEEEEEEEEEAGDDSTQTIRALQKQLADMQNALAGLGGGTKPAGAKSKKAKGAKSGTKKGSAIAASKSKPAPVKSKPAKKVRQVTYEEKQEISEAVGMMNNEQVEELTRIITTNCTKYANQDEMELEIDELPNHVQAMLLTYVRSIFGNPHKKGSAAARADSPDDLAAADDDDFEPRERRAGKGGKRKKHKPMGKHEQQVAIDNIQKQLAQFQSVGASGNSSPGNVNYALGNRDADTSGDDESEESEEE